MRAVDIIIAKRSGRDLLPDQIQFFISEYVRGTIPDYQAAALLMAIAINGMSPTELTHWTNAMLHSGRVLDLKHVGGLCVDKHSTGGVGDKISLCLAPAVAACGVPVPMVSGRGLGHTGGTLDKLEAIEGFDVHLPTERFIELVGSVGVCMIGQTEDIAPADRKLYALRDVTGTVESIPLIASSIMSKKLAEGIDALVLDVKVGKGAFMEDERQARRLAETLVEIGTRAGRRVTAYLTDMNQVLGREVGNASEVAEAIEVLQGSGPPDIRELTVLLGAEMCFLGGRAKDIEAGRRQMESVLENGEALSKFDQMVAAQGGDARVAEEPDRLPSARMHKDVPAKGSGYVVAMNPRQIGIAAMLVGAGRQKASDQIDPAVGITMLKRIGDPVRVGEPVAVLHHNGSPAADESVLMAANAFEYSAKPPRPSVLVLDRIQSEG